jgi:hypothetical protein
MVKRTIKKHQIYFEVYPRGDKLDLTFGIKPVAWFKYEAHALKFCKEYWPTIGEIHKITKKDLIKKLTNEI